MSSPCKHRKRMPLIGGYHLCGLANILTELESSSACIGYACPTSCSPSTPSYMSTGTSESIVSCQHESGDGLCITLDFESRSLQNYARLELVLVTTS
ncbi:hypothetical protein TNCV_537771 [Trichonephila clavipes]|nr:hypothetical protein TNCV_537771 [Trichonephila clavipes]